MKEKLVRKPKPEIEILDSLHSFVDLVLVFLDGDEEDVGVKSEIATINSNRLHCPTIFWTHLQHLMNEIWLICVNLCSVLFYLFHESLSGILQQKRKGEIQQMFFHGWIQI